VSIVVVLFRASETLQPLLQSILSNRTEETELIVIDGGSDDGTVELLEQCGMAIDFWSSEPDRGIYDAMNKGIKVSLGRYILHLNSGDKLVRIPTDRLRQCVDGGVAVACFSVLMNQTYLFRPRTGLIMKIDNAWHHQGTFYQRSSHPGYDLQYKVFSDFDLNQRLMLSGVTIRLFEEIVAEHTTDGVSSRSAPRREVYRIIKTNFGWGYLVLASIRFGLNAIRRWFKASGIQC